MEEKQYETLMNVITEIDEDELIVIVWSNGLSVRCSSYIGAVETSLEPEDEGFVGERVAIVNKVDIIEQGNDDSVMIFNNGIEINLTTIPEKVMLEDGTVVWENSSEKA